jgi:hypothetical protein
MLRRGLEIKGTCNTFVNIRELILVGKNAVPVWRIGKSLPSPTHN